MTVASKVSMGWLRALIIGPAEIRWNEADLGTETGGTQRFWDLEVEEWGWSALPVSAKWVFVDYSPHNPSTTDTERNPR